MRGVGNRRNVCDVSSNLGTWDLPTCDDQTCAVLTIDEMNAMSTVPVPKMWRIRALWCEILDARLAPPLISAQERWPDVSTACAAQTCDALSGIAYMVSTASCATATGMCPPPACMHAGYTPSATALTCYDTNSNTPAACTARTCAACRACWVWKQQQRVPLLAGMCPLHAHCVQCWLYAQCHHCTVQWK